VELNRKKKLPERYHIHILKNIKEFIIKKRLYPALKNKRNHYVNTILKKKKNRSDTIPFNFVTKIILD